MSAIWNTASEWDNEGWRDQAACRHTDANLFFPSGSTGTAIDQIEAAKAVCRPCPVQAACLRFAFETNQEAGVWGGDGRGRAPQASQDLARRPPAPDEVSSQVRVDVGLVWHVSSRGRNDSTLAQHWVSTDAQRSTRPLQRIPEPSA